MNDNPSIEERRLALDRERLEHERQLALAESRFVKRHAGALLTSIVSLIAVVVSGAQIWVASIDHRKQVEHEIAESRRADEDRRHRWMLDAASFVMNNRAAIYSADSVERNRIRDMMIATFPPEITRPLFRRLELSAPPDHRAGWAGARRMVETVRLDEWTGTWETIDEAGGRRGTLRLAADSVGRVVGTYDAGPGGAGTLALGIAENGIEAHGAWKGSAGDGRIVLRREGQSRFVAAHSNGNEPAELDRRITWSGQRLDWAR